MPFYELFSSEETKNWGKSHKISLLTKNFVFLDGLLEYIKNNVPAYVNAAHPYAMKSIDNKLKQFMETVVLQEGEKIRFCKVHDVESTPSSYGKVYYAERRNDRIHLMATIKKG
jgi:hypothetical protein